MQEKNFTAVAVLGILFALVLAAGCSEKPSTAPPGANSVSISNFAFSQKEITVKAGTTVTWTNNDSAPHTVTSDSGSELSSASLAKGQSYSHTFTQPGTYAYHCSVHPQMAGKVAVQ